MAAKRGYYERECSHIHCNKTETGNLQLKRCSGCAKAGDPNPVRYCSVEHQKADWTARHKNECGKIAEVAKKLERDFSWKWRATKDGSYHFGECELITWSGKSQDGDKLGKRAVYQPQTSTLVFWFDLYLA